MSERKIEGGCGFVDPDLAVERNACAIAVRLRRVEAPGEGSVEKDRAYSVAGEPAPREGHGAVDLGRMRREPAERELAAADLQRALQVVLGAIEQRQLQVDVHIPSGPPSLEPRERRAEALSNQRRAVEVAEHLGKRPVA